MRGMKTSLLIPFSTVLLIIVAINVLAFRYFVKRYVHDGIREQLVYTATGSKVLIKKEIAEVLFEEDTTKIATVLQELNRILRSAKTNLNVELMLFSETGEMIYPSDTAGTFLDEELIRGIRETLKELDDIHPRTISSDAVDAAVVGYRLTELPISNIPYVVFASSLDVADGVRNTVTGMMVLLLALAGIAGIVLISRLADRVVDPVRNLSDAARRIGERRRFVPGPESNIREIDHLTASIHEMSDRIDSYDNAQRAFLQNASHELRTPLMSIQGYAEGIEKGLFPDPAKAGAIIGEESRKLNKLLAELLMLSRIENRNYEAAPDKAVLNDFIREYAHTLEGLALKGGRTVEYHLCDEPLTVLYNETLFGQCFMNVAGNAIRYSEHRVTISVYREDRSAVIAVEDDGKGVDPGDLPHLFERFYKGPGGQFGLGLAIAKTAIEAMGGDIRAMNGARGARFLIRIPLA